MDRPILPPEELPDWVQYPPEYLRLLDQQILNLDPWFIMSPDEIRALLFGLFERYPARALFPFARREDRDDVACWDRDLPGKVVIIHDYASPGFEQRKTFPDFWGWFRQAVDDMIAYEPS